MNHPRPIDLAQRDLAYIVHPYTNFKTNEASGPFIIDRGEGVYVYDNDGRRYLEGMAGLWSTSLGFSEPRLAEAAAKQFARLPYSQIFGGRSHEPGIRLAEELVNMTPDGLNHVLFANSGSEANDAAVQDRLVLQQPDRAEGEEEAGRPLLRLSRHHRRIRQPDRPCAGACGLRPAARPHGPRRRAELLPLRQGRRDRRAVRRPPRCQLRGADPARRPGEHRRVHRRAGDGRRRRHRSAARLLRGASSRS